MAHPLAEPTRDLPQCLDAWVDITSRLARSYGVRVHYHAMPVEDLGEWDPVTTTLDIRSDADLPQQVWILQELWRYLAIGPHASPAAVREPLLRLVAPAPSG